MSRREIAKVKKSSKVPKSVNCELCIFKCQDSFTADERFEICKYFWNNLDKRNQRKYILLNTKKIISKRSKLNSYHRKYRATNKIYSLEKNGVQIRVCQKFFQSTLSISNGPIRSAFGEKKKVLIVD